MVDRQVILRKSCKFEGDMGKVCVLVSNRGRRMICVIFYCRLKRKA